MFTDHFSMRDNPFSEKPPLDHLLVDQRFTDALARLDYFTHDGTLALISAATGLGKSSLLKIFSHRLNPTKILPVYVHLTQMKSSSLLKLMIVALGEEAPARGKERYFLQILDRARHSDKTLLFLLDESHLLSHEALVDLRLLISSPLEDQPPIKIILCGQDHLLQHLKRTTLLDLLHRVDVHCRLRPLSQDETLCYIDFRLKAVAAPRDLIDKDAKALIHDYSNGVPRLINHIASSCLILAATQGLQRIDEDLVHKAWADFKLP